MADPIQRIRIIREPPRLHARTYCAVGVEGIITNRHTDDQKELVSVKLSTGIEIWLLPEHFEVIVDV